MEDKLRALHDGLSCFEQSEYGGHVLGVLNQLIEGETVRCLNASSWDEFRESKIKRAAYDRMKQVLLLISDI